MIFLKTDIEGAYIVEVEQIKDERGFFGRAFCQKEFEEKGLNGIMVQTNLSANPQKATLRGLHMQVAPYGEAKLVRCTRGAIFDVLVDMRPQSPTYTQWFGIELNSKGYTMLYVPAGCAHGYLTLEADTEVTYQVSQFYTAGAEVGFRWNDPAFNIQWPLTPQLISAKDQQHPLFKKQYPKPEQAS